MAMFRALRDTALKLQRDTSIRAVVLAGRGDAFSAGLDVKSVALNPMNMVIWLTYTYVPYDGGISMCWYDFDRQSFWSGQMVPSQT